MNVISCKNTISILLVLATSTQLLGQPLPPTKWHRLRARHVDIIFRGSINREAQRIAYTLEHSYEPIIQSLGTRPAKITIVLRNQKTNAVSSLTLNPRRVELCSFPSQDYSLIGTSDWLSLLIVHEFRHVAQHACLKQNLNRLSYWLGGDEFFGGMIFLNLPKWFFEGDAVGIETALTQSGRGRIPYFSLLYRTNLLARRRFSYAKQILGSFKDCVPDYYKAGYYMTVYLRRKYGADVVADILYKTTLPDLFTTAVRRATGSSLLEIYEDANQELKAYWQQQLKGLKLTQATTLHARKHTDYTDYAHPQLDEQGNIIVLKSGIGTVAKFVRLNGTQHERSIFTPGNIGKNVGFSTAKNKIVWVETIPDVRWKDRSYRVIQCYDTQTKLLKRLTHKSRYGTAALSPDATQIVACESDEGYNHQLVILDAEAGQILKRLPNPDNHFYLTPQWSADGKHIVVVKNVRQRVTIALIDVATGEIQDLLPYSTEHLGCPVLFGKYVFYNSAYSGIDNIYAIDLATHRRYQVTSRKYGAYNPIISADGCWLIFNDFTKDGMDVAKMPLEPKQWTPLEEVEDRTVHYYAPLVTQESNSAVLENIPQCTYLVKRYHSWKHVFNVHSWLTLKDISLNTNDPQHPSELLQEVQASVLQSKDLLDTTALNIGYLHNFKEKLGKAFAKISYEGWYPDISLEGGLIKDYKNKTHHDDKYLSLSLGLPFQFVRGQYTQELGLNTKGVIRKESQGLFYTQEYKCQFSRSSKKSPRDIYPPWSQELEVEYSHMPKKSSYHKQRWSAQTKFYFPGFFKHHAAYLHAKYAEQTDAYGETWYRSQLKTWPPNRILNRSRWIYVKTPSANIMYAFPLCYPDLSVGFLFYLKRLYAEVGYCFKYTQKEMGIDKVSTSRFLNSNIDYPILKSLNITTAPQYKNTISLTLLADLHLFTFLNIPQLSVGVKYFHVLEQRTGGFRLVCSMAPSFNQVKKRAK